MLSEKLQVTTQGVLAGQGLIASQPISPGEVLWRPDPAYPLVDGSGLRALRLRGNTDFYSQVDNNLYARNSLDAWRFNHSCLPNAMLVNRQSLAIRNIGVGEEVTYDYGLTEVGLPYRFWCDCHTAACRTLVTNRDYLDKRLLHRAARHVPGYVLDLGAGTHFSERCEFLVLRGLLRCKHRYFPAVNMPRLLRRQVHRVLGRGYRS